MGQTAAEPEKIAILGGGMAALTVALRLTNERDWKSRFSITVYQLGWRLGGKGASGRGLHDRIEEHGLHIFLGFYENAFGLMRNVYKEHQAIGAPGARPLEQAFYGHCDVYLTEQVNSTWKIWPVPFPRNSGVPGDDGAGSNMTADPNIWDYLVTLVGWLRYIVETSEYATLSRDNLSDLLLDLLLKNLPDEWRPRFAQAATILDLLALCERYLLLLDADPRKQTRAQQYAAVVSLEVVRQGIDVLLTLDEDTARRLFIVLNMGTTIMLGLIREGLLLKLDELDVLEKDFEAWLLDHGGSKLACSIETSAPLRGFYDLVFAYANGDTTKPSFAAGPALRSILRTTLSYKGAVLWKMQGAMGDVIFTPIYRVLQKRGVKFEFFSKVENLGLNHDGSLIENVRVVSQVKLKNPGEYQPLKMVKDLECWPSEPLWDQIEDAGYLQGQPDLESFCSEARAKTLDLRRGKHFDKIVLGISIGSFPYICSELMRAYPLFAKMVTEVKTVRTMAAQFWLTKSFEDLGWNHHTAGEGSGGNGPLVVCETKSPTLDAFVQPLNTWAAMTHLIPLECWEQHTVIPAALAYFCGPMTGSGLPLCDDSEVRGVERTAHDFADRHVRVLWPNSVAPGGGFDWSLIVSKYSRANINPSDLYVQSQAGTTHYRLLADGSGVANLVLAGDWTSNGFNAGCIEAAVMSGIQAANAISGESLKKGLARYSLVKPPEYVPPRE